MDRGLSKTQVHRYGRDEKSMKYVGIYWTVFAPLMKKSIRKRFNKELADKAIGQGKFEYKRMLSRADELGPGNHMAMNAYFAYVFAGAWLGSGKEITPDSVHCCIDDNLKHLTRCGLILSDSVISLIKIRKIHFLHKCTYQAYRIIRWNRYFYV